MELCNRNLQGLNKKYIVYDNDLKFRELRNIKKENADWDTENVKEQFGADYDTIVYRLKESKKNGFQNLDFSRLNLEKFPNLTAYKHYSELCKNLKYLFLNDNKLRKCDDKIQCFSYLEVLDVSFNEIVEVIFLPKYLKEFVCATNKITNLGNHKYLEKIDCSFNQIENLGYYDNLQDLICNDNKLTKIQSYDTLNRLICKNNPVVTISKQLNLKYLDCSLTNITNDVGDFPNLTSLICNFTKVNDIGKFHKLESLEIIGCNMKIPYIKTLNILLCQDYESILISSKYKIKKEFIEKNNACIVFDNCI